MNIDRAWFSSQRVYHPLAQVPTFLEIHSNEIFKVLLNFRQVQILHIQGGLQAVGETNNYNKLFSHTAWVVCYRGGNSLCCLGWPESQFQGSDTHSPGQFVLLKPLSSLSTFQRQLLEDPEPLFCVSQDKLSCLFLTLFSKWTRYMWGHRHVSEPGVERLIPILGPQKAARAVCTCVLNSWESRFPHL